MIGGMNISRISSDSAVSEVDVSHSSVAEDGDFLGVANERLEADICQLAADLAAGTARWLDMVAEYDRRKTWEQWECRSMAYWLAGHIGMSLITARQHVHVAQTIQRFPVLKASFAAGRLTFSRVRALCRIVTPETEAASVEMARYTTATQLERIAAGVERAKKLADPNADDTQFDRRKLHLHQDDDGSWILRAVLPAEVGSALQRALTFEVQHERNVEEQHAKRVVAGRQRDAAASCSTSGPCPEPVRDFVEQQRVDALHRLVTLGHITAERNHTGTNSNRNDSNVNDSNVNDSDEHNHEHNHDHDHNHDHGANATDNYSSADDVDSAPTADIRPLIVVHRFPDGDELENGPAITAKTADRLACDADIIEAVHTGNPTGGGCTCGSDENEPRITYTKARRTPTATARRALIERDQGCRFKGCGRKAKLHCHHIKHHAKNGPTISINMIMLCDHHHVAVHRNYWIIEGNPNGALTFTRPGLLAPKTSDGDIERIMAEACGPISPQMYGDPFNLNYIVSAYLDYEQTLRNQWARAHGTEETVASAA